LLADSLGGAGLGALSQPGRLADEGYKLAADFCQHYDSRYGNSLNGPSRTKIMEIVRFMFNYEAIEEDDGR
jgi:hypothetical protein